MKLGRRQGLLALALALAALVNAQAGPLDRLREFANDMNDMLDEMQVAGVNSETRLLLQEVSRPVDWPAFETDADALSPRRLPGFGDNKLYTKELCNTEVGPKCTDGLWCHDSSGGVTRVLDQQCLPCWECCADPDGMPQCSPTFNNVLDRSGDNIYLDTCKCKALKTDEAGNPQNACSTSVECGEGEFCFNKDATTRGECKSCAHCMSDADMNDGTACSDACVSGALDDVPKTDGWNAHEYVKLMFLLRDFYRDRLSMETSAVGLVRSDIEAFDAAGYAANINEMSFTLYEVASLFISAKIALSEERMIFMWEQHLYKGTYDVQETPTQTVPAAALALMMLTRTPAELLCPDPATVTTTFLGCACNVRFSPGAGRCPAGTICSKVAYGVMPASIIADAELTGAVCSPCQPGDFCPEGTVLESIAGRHRVLDCPEGSFCSTPASREDCPAGNYCVKRSVKPLTCNMNKLLSKNPFQPVPLPDLTVVDRVFNKGDPLSGNFCNTSSSRPNEKCPKGYYCPTPGEMVICPKGYYCPPQTDVPLKCASMAVCDEGTAYASWSNASAILVVVVALVLCLPLARMVYNKQQQMKARRAKGHDDAKPQELILKEEEREETMKREFKKNLPAGLVNKQAKEEVPPLPKALAKLYPNQYSQYAIRSQVKPDVWKRMTNFTPAIRIEFRRLALFLKNPDRTPVLRGVTGEFRPGDVSAIMGPSGCGKSSFLNVLSGRAGYGIPDGHVKINGQEESPTSAFDSLSRITGFVPQDDVVHDDLTVRENMFYSAMLRTESPTQRGHNRITRTAYARAVVEVSLDWLGIGFVAHRIVGNAEKRGISGGQRKRVNIGLELVARPSVLFLDEPTSGLDASASIDLIDVMREVAKAGMNVITVIHQPRTSIFNAFSKVLFLGVGGVTVYQGVPALCRQYFTKLGFEFDANENVADFCLDVISGKMTSRQVAPGKWKAYKRDDLSMIWQGTKSVTEGTNVAGRDLYNGMTLTFTRPEAHTELTPELMEMLIAQFDAIDKNGNGELDRDEIHTLLCEELKCDVTMENIDAFVEKLDRDGIADGEDKPTLNKQELLLGLCCDDDDLSDEEMKAKLMETMDDILDKRTLRDNDEAPEAGGMGKSLKKLGSKLSSFGSKKQSSKNSRMSALSSMTNNDEAEPAEDAHSSVVANEMSKWLRSKINDWGRRTQPEVYESLVEGEELKCVPQEIKDSFMELFDEMDEDRSGALDAEELESLFLVEMKLKVDPVQVEGIIHLLDKDMSGAIDKIELMDYLNKDNLDKEQSRGINKMFNASRRDMSIADLETSKSQVMATMDTVTEEDLQIPTDLQTDSPPRSEKAASMLMVGESQAQDASSGDEVEFSEASLPNLAPSSGPPPSSVVRHVSSIRSLGEDDSQSGPVAEGVEDDAFLQFYSGAGPVGEGEGVEKSGKSLAQSMMSVAMSVVAKKEPPSAASLEKWSILRVYLKTWKPSSWWMQALISGRRCLIKRQREFIPMVMMDIILLMLAAFVVGAIHGSDASLARFTSNIVMAVTTLGVLSMVTFLRTFSNNRLIFKRERSAGFTVVGYFLSQNVIDLVAIVIWPILFMAPYWSMTMPGGDLGVLYLTGLLVTWWISGMAYVISNSLKRGSVLVAGVFIALVFGAFLNGVDPTIASVRGGFGEALLGISYNRWAMEALSINEMQAAPDTWRNQMIIISQKLGLCKMDTQIEDDGDPDTFSFGEAKSLYTMSDTFDPKDCDEDLNVAYGVLFAQGLVLRAIAMILMYYVDVVA